MRSSIDWRYVFDDDDRIIAYHKDNDGMCSCMP